MRQGKKLDLEGTCRKRQSQPAMISIISMIRAAVPNAISSQRMWRDASSSGISNLQHRLFLQWRPWHA